MRTHVDSIMEEGAWFSVVYVNYSHAKFYGTAMHSEEQFTLCLPSTSIPPLKMAIIRQRCMLEVFPEPGTHAACMAICEEVEVAALMSGHQGYLLVRPRTS